MSVLPLHEVHDHTLFGEKACRLGRAIAEGLPVPNGYGVSCDTVTEIINGDHNSIEPLFAELMNLKPMAVRSSAVHEDSDSTSFAGQYESHLNITSVKSLLDAITSIAHSASSARVLAYKEKFDLDTSQEVGVIVQKMILADVSGVMFTCNPMHQGDERVIESAWGLGEAVASGMITPDLYAVERGGIRVDFRAGRKELSVTPDPNGGTVSLPVPSHLVHQPTLEDMHIMKLDALASQCEQLFGRCIDIEWAFEGDKLYLLQCRSITT